MRRAITCILIILLLSTSASASEFQAPAVPPKVKDRMPESDSFGEGLWEMMQKAVYTIHPELIDAMKTGASAMIAVILVSIVQSLHHDAGNISEIAGVITISMFFLTCTNSMIGMAADTITEISEYGKLLLPVLAAALAAQGGVSTSASLYAGTAILNAVLSGVLSGFLRPMVYCFVGVAIAAASTGESVLKNIRDLIKTFSGWCLKVLLTVFTTYMSISGVVSGTTDAVALKATKVTISSFVPVVGSILSDASEAILLSAGIAKNAAGIYGIFAVLAIFLVPFLNIGVHYIVMKGTFALSGIFGVKRMVDLIGDFSTAMGLLLAMTGTVCLLQLISTVCFLKGVGT